jgi:hypothetical protein
VSHAPVQPTFFDSISVGTPWDDVGEFLYDPRSPGINNIVLYVNNPEATTLFYSILYTLTPGIGALTPQPQFFYAPDFTTPYNELFFTDGQTFGFDGSNAHVSGVVELPGTGLLIVIPEYSGGAGTLSGSGFTLAVGPVLVVT